MRRKRVHCFDLWNTIVRSSYTGERYEDILIARGVQREAIYPFVRDHLMTKKLTYRAMAEKLFAFFQIQGTRAEYREMLRRWRAENRFVVWDPDAQRVLCRCRSAGDAVVLITNTTHPAWEDVEQQLKVSRFFDRLFLSWEKGRVKPDPSVWESVESWFPDVSQDCFWMIGDNFQDDLRVPYEGRGWNVYHVE